MSDQIVELIVWGKLVSAFVLIVQLAVVVVSLKFWGVSNFWLLQNSVWGKECIKHSWNYLEHKLIVQRLESNWDDFLNSIADWEICSPLSLSLFILQSYAFLAFCQSKISMGNIICVSFRVEKDFCRWKKHVFVKF